MDIWESVSPIDKIILNQLLKEYIPPIPAMTKKDKAKAYRIRNKERIKKYQVEYYQDNIIKKRLENKKNYQKKKLSKK